MVRATTWSFGLISSSTTLCLLVACIVYRKLCALSPPQGTILVMSTCMQNNFKGNACSKDYICYLLNSIPIF